MSEQQAMDWADAMALDIIAIVHRYRVETARQLIAAQFRVTRSDGETSGAKGIVDIIHRATNA